MRRQFRRLDGTPLSMLAQFHREIVVPDIERIVGASELRLRDEMYALHDSLLVKFERLETEYEAIKVSLARVAAGRPPGRGAESESSPGNG